MANKFPLILNTSANQIQEIASGDNLDLTGCKIVGLQGINSAGIVTFTKAHVGAATTWGEDLVVTGNARVTGILTVGTNSVVINGNDVNITGVTTAANFKTGTSNLHNVGIELAGINVLGADTPIGTGATIYNSGAAVFTGIVTATNYVGTINTPAQPNITSVGTLSSLNVSGNVSIGGTLTYEDVTNIDAVGLITASGGINVSGGNAIVAGMLDVDGPTHLDYVSISGVTTAAGAVDINADLDVDGHTNLDNVSVSGVSTFASNITRQGTGDVSINLGSTNAGGATIVLDGDSNGDFSGNDYSIIRHDSDGNLVLTANSPGAANCYIMLGGDGDYGAMFKEGAESLLRWDNSTKIQTGPAGVIITGVSTADGFSVGDNEYISVGAGGTGDLLIYHNGDDSVISDVGTGYLRIHASDYLQLGTGHATADYFLNCESTSGSVYVNHAGNSRFQTTGHGAVVTGILTATGGFNIGIQSGHTLINTGVGNSIGIVTAINFVGSGNTVVYNSSTKTVDIAISGGGGAGGISTTYQNISSTSATGIATFSATEFRAASIILSVTQGTSYQAGRYMVIHDGTTPTVVEESAVATGSMLASFDATIGSGNLTFRATMGSSGIATVGIKVDTLRSDSIPA